MNVFWILAIALAAAAVAGLLPALFRARPAPAERHRHQALHETRLAELRRDVEDRVIDEQQLAGAENEIARALLEETSAAPVPEDHSGGAARWLTAAIIVCMVPAVALLTYLKLGEPTLAMGSAAIEPAGTEFDQKTIDEMIASLEQRLVDTPDSAEGWLLLGRSYMTLNRYDDAVRAMARAHELIGDVPQVLLQYADALAMANDGRLGEDARSLVARALAAEPDNVAALWLAGLAAAETGERGQALDYLRRARTLSARDGAPTTQLDALIHGLEMDAGPAPAPALGGASVGVRIDVKPALRTRIDADDVLFVFARAPGREGPPLAVARATADNLPREFVLDDTMAMAPMFKLKRGETVTVTARISKSGNPGPQAGDLQGVSQAFVVGETGALDLLIDQVVE